IETHILPNTDDPCLPPNISQHSITRPRQNLPTKTAEKLHLLPGDRIITAAATLIPATVIASTTDHSAAPDPANTITKTTRIIAGLVQSITPHKLPQTQSIPGHDATAKAGSAVAKPIRRGRAHVGMRNGADAPRCAGGGRRLVKKLADRIRSRRRECGRRNHRLLRYRGGHIQRTKIQWNRILIKRHGWKKN
ncbi:hypothetical protein V8G54_015830, partial [Vigna mungo]